MTVTFWVMELDRLKVQVNSPPLSEAEPGVQERDTVGFVVEPASAPVIVKLLLLESVSLLSVLDVILIL